MGEKEREQLKCDSRKQGFCGALYARRRALLLMLRQEDWSWILEAIGIAEWIWVAVTRVYHVCSNSYSGHSRTCDINQIPAVQHIGTHRLPRQ